MDFWDWHNYALTPRELRVNAEQYRDLLDEFGFTEAKSFNTEWNIFIDKDQASKENALNAAFTASSLITMQDSVDMAFRYRGPQDNNILLRITGFDLSLFAENGQFKRPALSHQAMSLVATSTPNSLVAPAVAVDGTQAITYIAGISDDASTMNVLISYFIDQESGWFSGPPDESVNINLTNLPFTQDFQVARYVISSTRNFAIVEQSDLPMSTTTYATTVTMDPNSVVLFHFTTSDTLPPEGPGNVFKTSFWLEIPVLSGILQLVGRVFIFFVLF